MIDGLGAAMFPNGLSTDLKGEFASGFENILFFFTSPFESATWDVACELLGGLLSAPGIPPGAKIDLGPPKFAAGYDSCEVLGAGCFACAGSIELTCTLTCDGLSTAFAGAGGFGIGGLLFCSSWGWGGAARCWIASTAAGAVGSRRRDVCLHSVVKS